MHHKSDLLIWDSGHQNDDDAQDVIFWNKYTNSEFDRIFSIPQLVEEKANDLKTKYLSLIYDFGEEKVDGIRIIDHLMIRQNFSYWWMTLITEKCNYAKSPQIVNIIKLMALEDWLLENKYNKLKLKTVDDELAFSISLLAKKLLIDFEWKKENKSNPKKNLLNRFFHSLPNIIQSPIWLMVYLISNWPLKGVGVKEWENTTATSTFISYLFNLGPEEEKNSRYKSRYWTVLTDLLDDNQSSTNWLHIYIKDKRLPSAKKARDLIEGFNREQKGNQTHVTLASFLTLPLIFRTLQDWYKVLKLNKLISEKLQENSGHLWPLFKKDCADSMVGIPAMTNLLYFNLFEKAMSALPSQKKGCYWKENVSWEFGFISAWQSAGHEKNLIGLNAASVVYWDLRCFFDPRTYIRKGQCDLPLPDFVGVTGEVSKNLYLGGGYPQGGLIELEALRYLYLSNFPANQAKRDGTISKDKIVLIVGDFLEESTSKQLNILSSALVGIDQPVHYIIKLHPACLINIEDFPSLNGEVSTKPIHELMLVSDIVYSGVITSAAIEAHCAGLPVIKYLDGKILNMSPLRGSKSVYFVKNPEDLSSAINGIEVNDLSQKERYFYLDPGLPRWKKWLINDFGKNEQIEGNS